MAVACSALVPDLQRRKGFYNIKRRCPKPPFGDGKPSPINVSRMYVVQPMPNHKEDTSSD